MTKYSVEARAPEAAAARPFDLSPANLHVHVAVDLAFNTQNGTVIEALSYRNGSGQSGSDMKDPASVESVLVPVAFIFESPALAHAGGPAIFIGGLKNPLLWR